MKAIAALIVLVAVVLGFGAMQELAYYPSDTKEFFVGAFVTPASFFFLVSGVMLWRSGENARNPVLLAGLFMFAASISAAMMGVMGYLALLMGVAASASAMGWAWLSIRNSRSLIRG